MKIRMLKTVPGSLDGIRVTTYEDGKEYDLSGTSGALDLAAAFLGAGMAEEAGKTAPVAAPVAAEPEEKAIEAAPENKAMAAPATKRQYNRKG